MNLIKLDGFFHPSMVKSKIHIIGCGAVGSTIAEQLARCGITDFVLYDHDIVEPHNIANQMFREKDIGRKKVDALAEILSEINPEVADRIETVPNKYVDQPLSGVVFLCVDKVSVRKAIAKQHQYNTMIRMMSDVRISLTDAQHYFVDWRNAQMVRNFLSTMNFTDEEAEAETPRTACNTTLSVCTTVRMICAAAVSNFMNFVKSDGEKYKKTVLIDAFDLVLDSY